MTTLQSDAIPEKRLRPINQLPVKAQRETVVYWMTSARRTRFNFGLQRAAEWSRELGKPLVVLEALRSGYPWASDRLHQFVLHGMSDNREALKRRAVAHYSYVEYRSGEGKGLLEHLASRAAVVVTDEYPTFFLPRMIEAAGQKLDVMLEAVDSNGILPMAAAGKEFATAYAFRRHLQKNVLAELERIPLEDPLADELPEPPSKLPGLDRWPEAPPELLSGEPDALADLPIDHDVAPTGMIGGSKQGSKLLERFLDRHLEGYSEGRNRPDESWASGLSPYLHFGHVSAHEVFLELMRRERWTPEDVVGPANGRRAGWWGVRENAEAYLDQIVTWRELGFNFCWNRKDHDRWASLPDWAKKTLGEHENDTREHVYSLEQFDAAETHDPLWNAAQRQLLTEGTIHNYLRMLWGKKILHWSATPRDALDVMIELNNRYALDGRDPNSYTGIFWVLGRHDRPWGPERPIFGKVRYMTSANTARKFPVKGYLERYGEGSAGS
jgi:deoxyribodipyrimidine photo-lyase